MAQDIYYVECALETVTLPDGRVIGIWILIGGERCSYVALPGAFPALPETWN